MKAPALLQRINWHIAASFAGNIGTAVVSLVFVPIYVRFLGIEAYGLIGFFLSIVPLLTLLDLGLAATLGRELARLSVQSEGADGMRHLTRTLEAFYWLAPLLVVFSMMFMADLIAARWLTLSSISVDEASAALKLMGVAFAARLPSVLYFAALVGLERVVLLNGLRFGLECTKSIGAVAALWLVGPTLHVFFLWQIFASLLFSIVLAVTTWRCLPGGGRPKVKLECFRAVARYAAGVSGVSITAAVLMQVDKVVLSRVLSLEAFGYYSLAWVVAGGMRQLVTPLTSVYLPKIARAVAIQNEDQIRKLYQDAGRLMSVIVVPAGLVLAAFSETALTLWTGDSVIASRAGTTLTFLVIGAIISGLASVPYTLQLAVGWTRPTLLLNMAATALVIPLTIVLAAEWAGEGAAFGWALLNFVYLVVVVHLTHRRVLPGETSNWYVRTIMLPIAPAVIAVTCFRSGAHYMENLGSSLMMIYILFAYVVTVLLADLVTRKSCRGATWA